MGLSDMTLKSDVQRCGRFWHVKEPLHYYHPEHRSKCVVLPLRLNIISENSSCEINQQNKTLIKHIPSFVDGKYSAFATTEV